VKPASHTGFSGQLDALSETTFNHHPGESTMKKEHIINGAIASLLALGALTTTSQVYAATASAEKCAGVAKAGKNDCGTSVSSCAATAKADREAEAWILVPKGTCEKIAGGHIQTSADAKPGGKSGELSPAAKAEQAGMPR
jgi:uncharacterized membrane protein